MNFVEFPKMARLSRECVITEKIDGTNASISLTNPLLDEMDENVIALASGLNLRVGSRTRWITPRNDNYGFAKWVLENIEGIGRLGEGTHFGEWWGQGIQRKYGLNEKRFSLFNTIRWCLHEETPQTINDSGKLQEILPKCIGLVPVLYKGLFNTNRVDDCLEVLKERGSFAAPGFMNPEGVVIYHIAGNVGFKKTIEKDEIPKSLIK